MDVPFVALKYVCSAQNENRYQPYGVIVRKVMAYERGARPVLYLSDDEITELDIPDPELWRVVKFQGSQEKGWIGWLHEREWRRADEFRLPKTIIAALVKTSEEAARLSRMIHDNREKFRCVARSVIPLQVMCQGLDKK
jgi:hypothetical protein